MAQSNRRVFYRRLWLNKARHQSHAHVLSNIYYDPPEDDFKGDVDAELSLADCGRQITLSFNLYDRERANSLFKAQRLRKVVNEFVAALEEADAKLQEQRKEWRQSK